MYIGYEIFPEMNEVLAHIDRLDLAGIDPDFDNTYQELERHFAEIRCRDEIAA